MRDIPIFIASSVVEFKDERKELIDYLWTLNDIYEERNVRLKWKKPENMSHEVFPDGTQSEIDKAICQSDFFFVIVGRDMGPYTLGEFETAWARRKERGKPKVYAYFLPPAGQLPEQSVLDFRKRLEGLKHYHKTCGSMAEVKLEMQIELFRNIDFGGTLEASSKEETAQKGQDAARELVREQLDEIAQLKAQDVSPETIAKMTEAYEEIRRLVRTYKAEPDALLDYMGFLFDQHLYDTGIEIGRWLENFYNMDKPGDDTLSRLKNRLGLCYDDNNQHEQAERYYREELEIERRMAAENPAYESNVAATCNNLGNLLKNTNRTEEAERYCREALEIRRRLANGNPAAYNPDVAATCNNLGILLSDTNRTEEAERYFREALEIRRRLANGNPAAYNPDVAGTCDNLGILLYSTNRTEEAERYFREALEIYRRLANGNPAAYNPDVAMTCNNLAVLIIAADKMEQAVSAKQIKEAEPLLQEANEIRWRFAAKNPAAYEPDVAIASYNLGVLEYKRNCPEAAKRYFEESLSLFEKFSHCGKQAQQCRDALVKL